MTTSPWLRVIGIGEDGLDGLSARCRHYVEEAEVLVGGARHLAFVPPSTAERLTWSTPFSGTLDAIASHKDKRVVVLASGDPMEYGVGVALARRFSADEMTVFPAAGAFSLACARLGWSRAEVETLTLHGRPLALLNASLRPGARLLILSEDGATPAAVATALRDKGYGPSRLVVLARLGGPHEERRDGTAEDWDDAPCHDLNTMAVECRIEKGALALPRVPGLHDTAFLNDGQLTKQTVRSATLAALVPLPGALLWDVGAGSGSIAIEWLRAEPTSQAVAVERDPVRAGRVVENAEALGVPRLEVITGEAPQALAGLAPPDAVFVGGGVSGEGLLEACWEALAPGGRLVANAVTEKGKDRLAAFFSAEGGRLTRIAVSHAEPGSGDTPLVWRDKHPVTQLAVEKPQ
ncbi:MAG: precorrin-6y C5,15-methyltransferase (decarboxylating) subunit CbiE [Alphaproteobacteria bacterium]|nr:precorrin-6y C5,15-methyltransferase (decarboxylating) subunit CbiE [Alphaproteobacteria bacterium]